MLPWQMKSILIIVFFSLFFPENAIICKEFRAFFYYLDFALKCVIMTNQSRIEQVITTC